MVNRKLNKTVQNSIKQNTLNLNLIEFQGLKIILKILKNIQASSLIHTVYID